MRAVNVAEVEHALDANHPVPCELIVATDLGAADEVATLARAVVGNGHHTQPCDTRLFVFAQPPPTLPPM